MEHEIRIDRSKKLGEEPATGHNRWHPDIPPAVECGAGDEVILETRDAFDGQIGPSSTAQDVREANLNLVHPLTGPVFVTDAEPGDLLEVEILEVVPEAFGFTIQVPGFGFLREFFPEPFIIKWDIADGWAQSPDLPGVRIPGAPFMGTIGLSPDRALMDAARRREEAALKTGGFVLPPDPVGAVPEREPIASEALRTVPPRETAGNVDIKQLAAGTRLLIPVMAPGGLFSAGDAHFAQGDGEVCGTAVEMGATLRVRFRSHKGEAARRGVRSPEFWRDEPGPADAPPRRYYATTGLSVSREGENRAEDLTLAAQNAVLNMIDYLTEHGPWSPQQAYAICSVAVNLKVSELVDVPNFVVSAFLPIDIFTTNAPRMA